MGVITYEMEIPTTIPPARIFKAFVLEFDTLSPKVVPQAIKNIELLEGDGGTGSIKKINFGEGSQFKDVKYRIEAIDKENFTYQYCVIGGDALSDELEKIWYETKFVAAPGGGSIWKGTSKYYTIGDAEFKLEESEARKERSAVYQAIEAYLLANPDLYN